jgi:hypothetical protein
VADEQAPIPIGVTGRLIALPLTNAAGNHAVLVRQADASRALLTGEKGSGDRERLIVVPLDEDVEVRIDGDALAIWLTQGSVGPPQAAVPGWANGIGFALLIALVGFAVLGSLTFFGWLFETVGWR